MESKYTERMETIGRNIAEHRILLGLTQQELADKVGISKSYLSKIEASSSNKSCSLHVLFDIADVLNVSINELFNDV